MAVSALNALAMVTVMGVIAVVLQDPPKARREVGGLAPTWAKEWRAAKRLEKLGMIDPLIDCLLIYLQLAHKSGGDYAALMALRKTMRARHRPQAMGTSGLGVDLDLGLRSIVELKLGRSLQSLMAEFVKEPEFANWTEEDVMRVVFRRALQLQVLPMYVVRWCAEARLEPWPARPHGFGQISGSCVRTACRSRAACFFGMLTGAVQHTGQYLFSIEVRKLRAVWWQRCKYTCQFARLMLYLPSGSELETIDEISVYRGGEVRFCGGARPVHFDGVVADALWAPMEESGDLFTVLVHAIRGAYAESHGVPASYRHVEGQTFAYTHSRVQHMWLELARTGRALFDGRGVSVRFYDIERFMMNRLDDLVEEALGEPSHDLESVDVPDVETLLAAKAPTERDHAVVLDPSTRAGCTAALVGSRARARGQHARTHASHS